MKKLVFVLFAFAVLFGCEKEKQSLPNRMYINGAMSSRAEGADLERLNWIVKHSWEVTAKNVIWLGMSFNTNPIGDPFYQRDTIRGKFLFWNTDVISPDGKGLGMLLHGARDMVYTILRDSEGCIRGEWSETNEQYYANKKNPNIVTSILDTVAYTPNSVLEKVRAEVTEALSRGDYERCYRIFDKEIIFVPITGAEWRALEARGEN